MDYSAFCKLFFAATGIPTTLLSEGHLVYSALAEALSIQPPDAWTVYTPSKNPEFCCTNPNLEYGHVRVEGTGYDMFIGPLFTTPVREEVVQDFYKDCRTPPDRREETAELLHSLPVGSHPQFIRYLSFLYLCLNHKEARVEEFFSEGEDRAAGRKVHALRAAIWAKENGRAQNTYDFERKLYRMVEQGDAGRLRSFME